MSLGILASCSVRLKLVQARSFLRPDRRADSHGRFVAGACPHLFQTDDRGNAPTGALEVVDELQKNRGRGVVDQRHQIGSPALSMMTADSRPGPTAKSRQIDASPSCRRVWFIESAGEPPDR
jgi:hypothetical protein